jgi:hypothetical protein
MYDAAGFQVQYDDHRRQMAWVNDVGWKFDPPTTRTGIRVATAQALVALATRLFPPALETGETASASARDAEFTRNATIA